jgi:hypothetical protein
VNVKLKEVPAKAKAADQNASSIMKLLQMSEKAIQADRVYDHENVFSELRAKIASKK